MTPEKATELLNDLEQSYHETVLMPSRIPDCADRGGMIRVCVSQNPWWYRKLCSTFQKTRIRKSRKPDTRIVRRDVIKLLTRIQLGLTPKSYILAWLDNNC